MFPITGRASSFLEIFVYIRFQKQNRKEKEEKETEQQQTHEFTASLLHSQQTTSTLPHPNLYRTQ